MRKLFSGLFAVSALVTSAGYALAITQQEEMYLIVHLALLTFVVMAAISAFYLFRSSAAWEASLVCPSCHQSAVLSPCVIAQPRPSIMALIFGGIVLTVLIHQSQQRRFRCNACSTESKRRTVGSYLAVAWCLSLILFIVAAVISE